MPELAREGEVDVGGFQHSSIPTLPHGPQSAFPSNTSSKVSLLQKSFSDFNQHLTQHFSQAMNLGAASS